MSDRKTPSSRHLLWYLTSVEERLA